MYKYRFALLLGGALALAVTSGPALGQAAPAGGRQGQRQNRGGRGVSLAALPTNTVDSLLKLTPEQKTKIAAIQEKFTADAKPLRPAQGQQPDPANRTKLTELSTQANKDIEALLTDAQKEKWADTRRELTLLRGAGVQRELYAELKLTEDQKKKLLALQKETAEKSRGLQPEQRQAANQEARQKAAEILTAEQKAAVEKYNKEHPRGRGRRQQP